MITDTQLERVMPRLPPGKLQLYLPHLNAAMQSHGIDTALRTAAFVAQLAHESGELQFMEEIWGPTPAQRRYEPVSELAHRLGNTEAGDGRRFKGRGPIQITGRANYRTYGELLGRDLLDDPDSAAQPEFGFETAALFWQSNGLNTLADQEAFVVITQRINGGVNGLAQRQAYYERAKAVLSQNFIPGDFVPRAPRALPPSLVPLTRGHEAIVELTVDAGPTSRTRTRSARRSTRA